MRWQARSISPRCQCHRPWCISITTLLAVFAFLLLPQLHPQSSKAAAADVAPLKVGFILVGPINDWGWNCAHNQGRLFLEKAMPKKIVTTVEERVLENAEAERVMEKMVVQGNKLIFLTS
jgi:basic membrane lipoprotein Med (substrate-binding protein (PBP1-ABC) superfamily)